MNDRQFTYWVEFGVHGAMRIKQREFGTLEDAYRLARRWSRSNSTGHYWAEVTRVDRKSAATKVITSFNLERAAR